MSPPLRLIVTDTSPLITLAVAGILNIRLSGAPEANPEPMTTRSKVKRNDAA